MKALRGCRGIVPLIRDLIVRMGWLVSTTPRPLYPRERPGTHRTGGWVGPRACLDVCEKSRHSTSPPMKMEQTQRSETLAFKLQTQQNNTEESTRYATATYPIWSQ
jgi:hypothetical protein